MDEPKIYEYLRSIRLKSEDLNETLDQMDILSEEKLEYDNLPVRVEREVNKVQVELDRLENQINQIREILNR